MITARPAGITWSTRTWAGSYLRPFSPVKPAKTVVTGPLFTAHIRPTSARRGPEEPSQMVTDESAEVKHPLPVAPRSLFALFDFALAALTLLCRVGES